MKIPWLATKSLLEKWYFHNLSNSTHIILIMCDTIMTSLCMPKHIESITTHLKTAKNNALIISINFCQLQHIFTKKEYDDKDNKKDNEYNNNVADVINTVMTNINKIITEINGINVLLSSIDFNNYKPSLDECYTKQNNIEQEDDNIKLLSNFSSIQQHITIIRSEYFKSYEKTIVHITILLKILKRIHTYPEIKHARDLFTITKKMHEITHGPQRFMTYRHHLEHLIFLANTFRNKNHKNLLTSFLNTELALSNSSEQYMKKMIEELITSIHNTINELMNK